MNVEGKIWLSWSRTQNHFHIEPEARGLEQNLQACKNNLPSDFITIGIFSDRIAASQFADKIRDSLLPREIN